MYGEHGSKDSAMGGSEIENTTHFIEFYFYN